MPNARVDRRLCHDNGREAFDYHGKVAGRTIGSCRVAVRTNRLTQSTRAFAPRSGANVANHRLPQDAERSGAAVGSPSEFALFCHFFR